MIKELYIDGYLVDIDDNFSIVRQYSSPFFSDVTQLKNNGSYSTKIPETQNNSFIMDYLEREDADTTFPYRGHVANYYVDSFPVFENAEVRVIDAFELQFVWGLNRGKYLPLFTRKLNEIVPNGTTILESDWVVPWKKRNGVDTGMFTPGKKYKYLNYISGERESEVKIIDGEEQPLTEAPEPFLSNLKEMTMHPYISFGNILDLIASDSTITNITKEISFQIAQNEIEFTDVAGLEIGDLVYSVGNTGDIRYLNIRITDISRDAVTFNYNIDEVQSEIQIGNDMVFSKSTISSSEFDALKQRLTNKGLILGGNKDDVNYEYIENYSAFGSTGIDFILGKTRYNYDVIVFNYYTFFNTHFRLSQIITEELKVIALITLNVNLTVSTQMNLCKMPIDGTEKEIISGVSITDIGGGRWNYLFSAEIEIEKGYDYSFSFIEETGYSVGSGGLFKIEYNVNKSLFAPISELYSFPYYAYGRYNCLMNLPDMTAAEFINQMLIMTGLFVGHDANGNMKFLSLDKFKANLLARKVYDWSGKVSQREKSYFQFNSNAQNNWIKFANSDDRTYTAKDSIVVDDTTLNTEKDLYTISFDLAEQAASGMAEFILYKQKVASSGEGATEVKTFSNEYSSKNDVCVYDDSGTAVNTNVLPQDFVTAYYGVYKDIIYRPRVLDIVVKLDFLETLEIDFEKPVYISDYGKYAVLLDINIPDDGLCNAKLLLINQTL